MGVTLKEWGTIIRKIETIQVNDNCNIYLANQGRNAFCLDSFNEEVIQKIVKLKPKTLICLDTMFEENDCLKTNNLLQFQDNDIEFKTI